MSSERYEFNRVTFALPAQAFRVTAFISTEERLPAVTEFVLRLLHTCGQVSLTGFRDYFGFSDAEALSVIESLDRQGYVRLTDESLSLSEQTMAKFDLSPDDCPWVTKLKKRTDVVPFDLLAFTALRRTDFVFATDNWVKLNPAPDMVGNSVSMARQAYRESFGQIERESARTRGQERERSFGVHSIESVEARRPSFIPLTLSLAVDQAGQFVSQLPNEFEGSAKAELLRTFRERIADEFEKIPPSEGGCLNAFLDLFQLDFLRRYVTGSHFDIPRYAIDVSQGLGAPAGVQPLFGSLYLKQNAEIVAAHVHEARAGRKGAPKHLSSLAWLAPDYGFWGRGEDFRGAVEMLGKSLKTSAGGDELYLFDYAQERQEALIRGKYSNTGISELHLLRPDTLTAVPWASSLELMLYPGQFAVVMVHIELDGFPGIRVSFGVLTLLPHHLHLVHRLLLDRAGGSRYAGRWSPKKQGAKVRQPVSLEEGCTFLAYSDFDARVPASTKP